MGTRKKRERSADRSPLVTKTGVLIEILELLIKQEEMILLLEEQQRQIEDLEQENKTLREQLNK